MTHTDKTTVLATYIQGLINTNKVALGIDNVLYGEQENIPGGITAVINSGVKNRSLDGVAGPGGRVRNRMIVIISIYNNKIASEASQSLLVDQIAENVEHLLHQNTNMGNNIIHGFVETWDPGIRYRSGSMYRVTQMIFVGQTKTNLTDIP